MATENSGQEKKQFAKGTQLLAGMCHNCSMCTYADRRPNSVFGKFMRWHRTWCPAWAAHTKVYGEKTLLR